MLCQAAKSDDAIQSNLIWAYTPLCTATLCQTVCHALPKGPVGGRLAGLGEDVRPARDNQCHEEPDAQPWRDCEVVFHHLHHLPFLCMTKILTILTLITNNRFDCSIDLTCMVSYIHVNPPPPTPTLVITKKTSFTLIMNGTQWWHTMNNGSTRLLRTGATPGNPYSYTVRVSTGPVPSNWIRSNTPFCVSDAVRICFLHLNLMFLAGCEVKRYRLLHLHGRK